MGAAETSPRPTRMIFIGSLALSDGFRLIGFETLTDPDVTQLDQLIAELVEQRSNAFLVIEQTVTGLGSKMLELVRREGGRIVLSEVPSLRDPSCLHCELDRQIERLMGPASLQETKS
jgi:vacuolar-type H+-ATPase subunit F/Vma7